MALTTEKPIRKYEGVVILHPDVSEADQKEFFKRNQETVQKFSGRVNHIDTWGKRRLANPIEKVKLGTYFHTTFEARGECVNELERLMKIDERVLRYVHVRLDDRTTLSTHVEDFHKAIVEANKREQEKEAKFQARRLAMQSGGPRGPREGGGGGYGRRGREEGGGEEDGVEGTEE